MRYHLMQTALRSPDPDNQGGGGTPNFDKFDPLYDPDAPPEGAGLAFALDRKIDGQQQQKPEPDFDINDDPDDAPDPDPKPLEKPDLGSDVDDDDDDFPAFPKIGDAPLEEPEPQGQVPFDEAKFDAETKAMLEAIEKKGHPGDVYQKLRGELKELRQRPVAPVITDVEKARIKELEEKAAEVDGLREKVSRITASNARLAVMESPEYVQNVVEPMGEMEAMIVEMAKLNNLDPEVLLGIVAEKNTGKQDAALEGIKDKLSGRSYSRLDRACDDFRAIAATKGKLLTRAEEVLKKSREQVALQEQIEAEKALKAFRGAQSSTFDRYYKDLPGLADSQGNLTPEGKRVRAAALSVNPDKLEDGDIAFAVLSAQMVPNLVKENRKLTRRIAELEKGAKPKGKSGEAPKGGKGDNKPQGLMSHMSQNFR